MRTNFTELREAVSVLTNALEGTLETLLGQANAEREELLALHTRMIHTSDDLHELSGIAGDIADVACQVEDASLDVAAKLMDSVENGLSVTPSCNYESFGSFCSKCGCVISIEDDYTIEDGEPICMACTSVDLSGLASIDDTDTDDGESSNDETEG